MTYELKQRELLIDLNTGEHTINPLDFEAYGGPDLPISIIGPVDYGWARYIQAYRQTGKIPDLITWGGGPLAGSRIPGTRRLVFCGYSPQWEGFYVSSLGGAAYMMHRVGVDFVNLAGRARQDSVLILNHKQGQVSVRLEPINPELLWNGYADPDGEHLIGFFALQQAVLDRYGSEFDPDWVRVFAVGPGARLTNWGIIGSSPIKKGRLTSIEDWAGRGGLGSRLLQQHRIAACIFGGDWEDPDLKDSREIDGYFQQAYGQSMIKVDLGATEKYRYSPGFQTGGTFGVNMRTLDDNLFSFNYTSIYRSDQERLAQHTRFILEHYLKQFNDEIITPKNYAHCGEPCSVACKKFDRLYKVDYEPYQALGPQCGIFDQRAAETLNHFVDAMGVDAIQAGGLIAWIMELVACGLLPAGDFGLPEPGQLRFTFESDPANFDLVEDSRINSDYAHKIAEMILFEPAGAPFRKGLRAAAEELDARYGLQQAGVRMMDRAAFTAHGKQGNMVPNQYWSPGMLSPMPMMGKYFVYYGHEYQPPRLLGRKCVERMVYELFSENSGICRFHRKWAEAIADDIIRSHYNLPVDYKAHQFQLSRQIYEFDGQNAAGGAPGVVFWQSERVIDMLAEYLEKWERFGLEDDSLHDWVQRFRQDKWAAARQYWDEVRAGIGEAFAAGAEAIPDNVPPQAAAASR